jgi:uncharacterized protein (TIGR02284 family)
LEVSVKRLNDLLNALIKNSLEMLEFYRRIYNLIDDQNLKQIFSFYLEQRKNFIEELKTEAVKTDPEKSVDNILSSLFKVIEENNHDEIKTDDEKSVLSECEKNEMKSVRIYQQSLDDELPQHLKELITNQLNDIREAHYHMKLLRDSR